MSYCENQKSLFHFLPGPPSNAPLGLTVYFPCALIGGGGVGVVTTQKADDKGPRKYWCACEHHPKQMFFSRRQILCMRAPNMLDYITRRKMVSGGPMEQWRGSYNIAHALAYMFGAPQHGSIHRTIFPCNDTQEPVLGNCVHSALKTSRWTAPSSVDSRFRY